MYTTPLLLPTCSLFLTKAKGWKQRIGINFKCNFSFPRSFLPYLGQSQEKVGCNYIFSNSSWPWGSISGEFYSWLLLLSLWQLKIQPCLLSFLQLMTKIFTQTPRPSDLIFWARPTDPSLTPGRYPEYL